MNGTHRLPDALAPLINMCGAGPKETNRHQMSPNKPYAFWQTLTKTLYITQACARTVRTPTETQNVTKMSTWCGGCHQDTIQYPVPVAVVFAVVVSGFYYCRDTDSVGHFVCIAIGIVCWMEEMDVGWTPERCAYVPCGSHAGLTGGHDDLFASLRCPQKPHSAPDRAPGPALTV